MKRGLLVVLAVVICVSSMVSGCQDSSSIKTQRPQNVSLDSTIVEFANVSFEKHINKSGDIDFVEVGWMFHNIAGKEISARIDVKFFDQKNIFLYNESKAIYNMPAGYTERYYSPGANRVIYDKAGVEFVDHVVISVTEI